MQKFLVLAVKKLYNLEMYFYENIKIVIKVAF